MNKLVMLGFIGLMLIFVISVGADFASYRADREVEISIINDDQALVELKPEASYAYISGDGKLVIDYSSGNINRNSRGVGIGPDSRYIFDCVFTVSNKLWENKTINVDLEVFGSKMIRIYSPSSSNHGASLASTSIELILESGEQACIGVVIDTSGKNMGDYSAELRIKGYSGK
jgi:hypothetical protein